MESGPSNLFGIALEQRFFVGKEKQEGDFDAIFLQFLELAWQQVDAVPGTRVDGDSNLADVFFLEHGREHGQHGHRQVVHAVIAGVFEQVQRDGLAGAGKSADQYEFHGGRA